MRIELTIKTDYLPTWGLWEGVRELIQNGHDAKIEHGASLDVRYRKDTETLVIENVGTVLPHEALLLGHTTKLGHPSTIGKFGEGLKLGVLALVRLGHKVKIRSGSEVWNPTIERSDKFNCDVLVFHIETGRKYEERVQVEVSGVQPEAWKKFSESFLFLQAQSKKVSVTSYGTLLRDAAHAGKIFVKGIYVCTGPYVYGYDLYDADLDRDRKLVNHWDLQYRMCQIWLSALNADSRLAKLFSELLSAGSEDVKGVTAYAAKSLNADVTAAISKAFRLANGAEALPVTNLAESIDLEHLGMRGVVVNENLKAVLEVGLGTVAENKKKLAEQPQKFWSWHDLDATDRHNLMSAVELLAGHVTLADVDVVSFRDAKIRGMWRDGRVLLNREILPDREETLTTLVHEVAHKLGGGDGEHKHVANLERLWSGIVQSLRGAK